MPPVMVPASRARLVELDLLSSKGPIFLSSLGELKNRKLAICSCTVFWLLVKNYSVSSGLLGPSRD